MERNETRGIPRPYHREENDQDLSSLIIDKVKKLIHTTDIEHVASNCIGRIGNPVAYQVIVKAANAENYKINFNIHDHDDI